MPVDRSLYHRVKCGDKEAREEVFHRNTGLIWTCIRKYLGLLEKDDLYQLGCIGLLKAIDGFDPDYGVRFSTFAVPHILGEMRRYLRDNTALKIERRCKELALQSRRAASEIKAETGEEATVLEIAERLGVESDAVVEALDATAAPAHFDDVSPRWGEPRVQATPVDGLENSDILDLRCAVERLCSLERAVVERRFFQGKTQAEIAAELSVSQAHVSRVEKRALISLRQILST
ncbi:MAG: sigma-70 family RNA polymerase sigma factor [Bacillota bacterium]|jgi:RNA polymerase sporulation-specific sigma factor